LCKQLSLFTTKVVADPLSEFLSGQKPSRFDDRSFAMDPFRLDPVEPGALGGQKASDNAHACFASAGFLPHRLIVRSQPGSDLLTHVPGSVIPNQDKDLLVLSLNLFTQPLQKIGGYLADWTSGDEAQVHATAGSFKHPITSERFGIRIGLIHRKFEASAVARPVHSSYAGWVGSLGSTTPHRGSQPPIRSAEPVQSERSAVSFSGHIQDRDW